jgi:hypothetical protein
MPFHFINKIHAKIPLSIPKIDVNIFLGSLWDDLESSVGPLACYHNYLKTSNPEIYEYNIHWAHKDLTFEAALSFYNHTAKGLVSVSLLAIDRETKKPDKESQDAILKSIKRTVDCFTKNAPTKPSVFISVPLILKNKLAGNYFLSKSNVTLLSLPDRGDRLIFPILSENRTEQEFESQNRAIEIVSMLSTITQQLFDIDLSEGWLRMPEEEFNELKISIDFNRDFVTDNGFDKISYQEGEDINAADRSDEIIDESDSLLNRKQSLPARADDIIEMVNSEPQYIQACKRFWEGLKMRSNLSRSLTGIHTLSYEIIAYIASIEALLDSSKITTEVSCPKCGTAVYKEEWTVSMKFKTLISELSGVAPALPKVFGRIYEDRSKFVHTGINLHNFFAHRPNRPAILRGKYILEETPDYYYNVHEFTGYILRRFFYRKLSGINVS